MSDPNLYTYPDPLEHYQGSEPLPNDLDPTDGQSFINPPSPHGKSEAYSRFVVPIANGARGGFDIHVCFLQGDGEQAAFARKLWERVRREFPELRIYKIWDKPIGPHVVGMLEVNVFSPEQFGAFVSWLVINRGPLSALVHPNTGDDMRDHTQRATWMGQPFPVNTAIFHRMLKAKGEKEDKDGDA